ncbi:hypothetical protein OKHIL_71280 [Mycolicibacterium mageritense]
MRAADTDRIQVAQLLTDAAAQGRLPMTEYEDRLAKAYAAETCAELARLSYDLPGATIQGNGVCRPAPSTLLLAIMSGFERRGRWNVPMKLTTFALFGGGVVDLRYADFTAPDVEIRTYSIFGGQTILVPPGSQRRRQRPRRDGQLRPQRDRRGDARRPQGAHSGLLAVGQRRGEAQKAPQTIRRLSSYEIGRTQMSPPVVAL